MMFGKFFKPQTHYVFDYKPRYYSERKERLKKLQEKVESAPPIISKNNLKNEWIKKKQSSASHGTMIRLAIIITILVGIATYVFDLHRLF